MVDLKSVENQLKHIKFDGSMWNRAEMRELPKILHEDEKIFECANGIYEGGFALLVATDMRLLLIDKKPLNYLTVEDLRFDMITELDYSHRMMGATITISAGNKTLKFKSYNQPRLRKLINHVQERMTEIKKEASEKTDNQQQHLEEINKQLQMYLLAQHNQLLQQQIKDGHDSSVHDVPRPPAQLSDYLFAQRLLEDFQAKGGHVPLPQAPMVDKAVAEQAKVPERFADSEPDDLLAEGQKEIFGKVAQPSLAAAVAPTAAKPASSSKPLEINALKIAYSKLPMALRNRKFGRPSFHAHSQQPAPAPTTPQTAA